MRIQSHTRRVLSLVLGLTLVAGAVLAATVAAHPIGHSAFQREWDRHDKAVAEGVAVRSWMWGPDAYTDVFNEDYAESPGGQRQVQYFDKSRMEITRPNANQGERWYVSNGLLVVELITGRMQLGDSEFDPGTPARVNVAGDPDATTGPTYASFTGRLGDMAFAAGSTLQTILRRNGSLDTDAALADYSVTAGTQDLTTGHRIASVFDAYFARTGPLWIDGGWQTGQVAGVYEVGLPISEAYWSRVTVDGTARDVLIQCFERRCLTYTPANALEWQVEMGNVGQHYYRWRYPDAGTPTHTATSTTTATATNTPTATATNTPTPTNTPTEEPNCHASYPDFCIPPPPPDLNCDDFSSSQKPMTVRHNVANPDPHGLDSDEDGVGCESG